MGVSRLPLDDYYNHVMSVDGGTLVFTKCPIIGNLVSDDHLLNVINYHSIGNYNRRLKDRQITLRSFTSARVSLRRRQARFSL